MALNVTQQIYESVKRSRSPLITFRNNNGTDVIASSLALAFWLKKLDKQGDIVCPNFKIPTNISFLPRTDTIKPDLTNLRKLVIDLDLQNSQVDKFSYKVIDDRLKIFITPKNGELTKDRVSCSNSEYRHDLIFTLNTPDLESLDKIYENNPDFFYNTPIINICNLPENEHFGHTNMVNVTAVSVAEILYELFTSIDDSLIDETIATYLLTGMIDKTKSFRHKKVTPRSLNIASQLIASGAQRDLIIKNLYQTKSVGTLKLWGTVLSHLETDPDQKIAWSRVTAEDFKSNNSSSKDLVEVIDELISSIPSIQHTAIFFQTDASATHCIIKTEKDIDLLKNFSEFNPTGAADLIRVKIDTANFASAKEQVLEYLKNLI
ncbi:MAG: DHH family phosphoesterase [Patescibacteria group bacterium]